MTANKQFFIGIDVSKPWFDASVMVIENHIKQPIITRRFENTKEGIKAFEKRLKTLKVTFDNNTLLVMENTGYYHRLIWSFCSRTSLPIHIGNAAHIKWSFGIARGKNDTIDSIRLCQYACKEADTLKATPPLDSDLLLLKDLITARAKLVLQFNAIKTYIKELKSVSDTAIKMLMEKAHKDAIAGIKKSIKSIEDQIHKIITANQGIYKNYRLLITVPSIGHFTAAYMICCTNNFAGKIRGKQLACYAGVVPFEHSSGISVKGKQRVHKMANKDLKKMLHLCAMVAIQFYPEFTTYYKRKKAEGKHSISILNAIRNKLVLRAVAVINNQRPYVDNMNKAA